MVNNDKYFNQSIINNDDVLEKLERYLEGIDTKEVIELVNKDIEEKNSNEEIFIGDIETPNYKITYQHDFVHWNAIFVCDELANKKYSAIVIKQEDKTIILIGEDHSLEVKRKTKNQELELKVILDTENETIEIEEKEKNIKSLNKEKVLKK